MFDPMSMLMGFNYDDRSPRERERDERMEAYKEKASKREAVPWDPNMKFEPSLKIQADTYRQPSLFDVPVCNASEGNLNAILRNAPEKMILSPCAQWAYRERIFPAGHGLETRIGNRSGFVEFDGDVKIPILNGRRGQSWREDPWMSFTPMEFFSLRPGVKRACGHTVVAGLGMGWQLEQVCKKRNVERVTLVEQSQGLVDWILPRLNLHGKDVEVLVGDAYEIVPALTADVALIDIFASYRGNRKLWRDKLYFRKRTARREGVTLQEGEIGDMWFWGA